MLVVVAIFSFSSHQDDRKKIRLLEGKQYIMVAIMTEWFCLELTFPK